MDSSPQSSATHGSRPFTALIAGLVYTVQFEVDPRDGTDRVIRFVVDRGVLGATRAEYFGSDSREALASDEALATLIPQPHSENVIRRFLADLALRLEDRPR